ncbi:MAG: alpha-amylase family glycosyl hydrolase [Treponema sp.]|nr:alpha-amylase family glycosyl hydrolase [Treponema sp.]
MSKWLNDAVFYEIYPQSFYDANGDGIGDIEGIIQKLDYIHSLGCNALWLNPCFDSPFKDAGYDVRDYKKVAPRYGTNDDLKRLFAEAHKRGMRVLLDLLPGHTSEEHEWFQKSREPKPNEYWNRYIWTDDWGTWVGGLKTIFGEADRNASYIVNFFKSQPALNYGFFKPDQVWQLPMDHPDCLATREALKDVMRFWLDAGCDGFRIDMAASLVKFDDPENSGTSAIWREVRSMLDADYPDAVIVSEWGHPERAIKAGFHADFLLHFAGDAYNSLARDYKMDSGYNVIDGPDNSFFKKDGDGDIRRFVDEYMAHYEATKNDGYISLISGNHDIPRLALTLSPWERRLFFAFIFTMPGVPFLYYGDEIGMRYLNLVSKEGGYNRTGARTPMQWNAEKNLGFSTAEPGDLYLPIDPAEDAPTVGESERDYRSIIHTVRALIALRHAEPDLRVNDNLEIVFAEKSRMPFVYRRGSLFISVNPSGEPACAAVGRKMGAFDLEEVYALGECMYEERSGDFLTKGQSFGVWRVKS